MQPELKTTVIRTFWTEGKGKQLSMLDRALDTDSLGLYLLDYGELSKDFKWGNGSLENRIFFFFFPNLGAKSQ